MKKVVQVLFPIHPNRTDVTNVCRTHGKLSLFVVRELEEGS